jgi:hypothetical protein
MDKKLSVSVDGIETKDSVNNGTLPYGEVSSKDHGSPDGTGVTGSTVKNSQENTIHVSNVSVANTLQSVLIYYTTTTIISVVYSRLIQIDQKIP